MNKKYVIGIMVCLIIFLTLSIFDTEDIYQESSFAELNGRHIINTTFPASDVYVNVTGMICEHKQNMDCNNDAIIITENGFYQINSQFSFSDGGNTEFHLALGRNGIRQEHCHAERKIGTGGDVGSASFTCIDELNATDVMTIMVENVDNTNNVEIHSINMNIHRIG